jgi:hypothetical protein
MCKVIRWGGVKIRNTMLVLILSVLVPSTNTMTYHKLPANVISSD